MYVCSVVSGFTMCLTNYWLSYICSKIVKFSHVSAAIKKWLLGFYHGVQPESRTISKRDGVRVDNSAAERFLDSDKQADCILYSKYCALHEEEDGMVARQALQQR